MRTSTKRFLVLYFLSFGLYLFYWYYHTMAQLKEEQNLDISPGWRTAGMFVPILNLFLLYGILKRINGAAVDVGAEPQYSPGGILAAWILIPMAISCLIGNWLDADAFATTPALVWLQIPLSLIGMAVIAWLLTRVNATATAFWSAVRPAETEASSLTGWEIAIVAFGFFGNFISYALLHWFYAALPTVMAGIGSGPTMY